MPKIKLPDGSYCLIDQQDMWIKDVFPYWRTVKGYVRCARDIKTEYGTVREDYYLHRLIVRPPRTFDIDHINRIRFDNRRSNLRMATRSENCRNVAPYKSKKKHSIHRGVTFKKNMKSDKRWMAYTKVGHKQVVIGYFKTEIEAAHAYNIFAKDKFGDFAYLNII